MAKPTIPKGTRDFLPHETRRRNYIFNTISTVFEKYGYAPIETPAMENLSTLTGKYGEEGDRLIFKILNSGEPTQYILSYSTLEQLFSLWNKPELKEELNSLKEEFKRILRIHLGGQTDADKDLLWVVIREINDSLHNPTIGGVDPVGEMRKVLVSGQPVFTGKLLTVIGSLFRDFLSKESSGTLQTESWLDEIVAEYEKMQEGDASPLIIKAVDEFFTYYSRSSVLRSVFEKNTFSKIFAEKALRYDLTVPFARFVVNNFNELSFPFKRYQIQPVWRADRPQKGRYREFYQCDADVVGSDSLLNEVEMIQLFDEVLSRLGLDDFTIKINNRKILSGIAEVAGVADQITAVTVALDKLDKIGADGVKKELRERGIPESAMQTLEPLMAMQGGNDELLTALDKMLANSATGRKGIAELREVLGHVAELGLNKAKLQVDVTLARGLDYYTGAIFEVLAGGVKMGSICGGGRYDDLTSIFGMDNLSGVGISFGADRIYDVLLELGKFPETVAAGTKVLFINFGENESRFALKQIKLLREAGISCELYPDNAKMKKQMKFANDKNVQYVALAGEIEIAAGKVNLKNMENGEQQEVEVRNLVNHLK